MSDEELLQEAARMTGDASRADLARAIVCHLTDPLERQRAALVELEAAREEWKKAAGAWSAVRAEAVQELKQGRTWAQVAELLGVSEPTAWNIAHPK